MVNNGNEFNAWVHSERLGLIIDYVSQAKYVRFASTGAHLTATITISLILIVTFLFCVYQLLLEKAN